MAQDASGTTRPGIPPAHRHLHASSKAAISTGLHIGDIAPGCSADTTTGKIRFHDWIGKDWVCFFSHPGDFTPVCTTEIGRTAQLADKFARRHVKPLGISTDNVAEHLKWIEDVNDTQDTTVGLPIVGNPGSTVARLCDMIHAHESSTAAVRAGASSTPRTRSVRP